MGRGRQKAKQMKVARRLKYSTPETDLAALQRELAGVADADSFESYADDRWDPDSQHSADSR
mgnify:CR=1 FL=1